MAQTQMITVNINDIKFSELALRTHKLDSDDIKDLADNIVDQGLLNLPSIAKDPDEEGKYIILDGSRRLSALKLLVKEGRVAEMYPDDCITLQLKDISSNIDILCAQIAGNANIVKTGNREYITALYQIASATDGLTMDELAKKAGLTTVYMGKLFETLKIPENVYGILKEGNVSVGNMITLSKLRGKIEDIEMEEEWVEKAKSLNTGDFSIAVQDKLDFVKKEAAGVERKFKLTATLLNKEDLEILLQQAKANFESDSNPENEVRYQVMKEIFQIDEVTAKNREDDWNNKEQEKKDKAAERKETRTQEKIDDQISNIEDCGFVVTKKEEKLDDQISNIEDCGFVETKKED